MKLHLEFKKDIRRNGHRDCRELRQYARTGHRPYRHQACGGDLDGRKTGWPEGGDRQFRGAPGQENGAGLARAGSHQFQGGPGAGAEKRLQARCLGAG